ncbi:ectoine/hydroxyectoine ABC transporter substrate-binding protein EhuB [Methylomarinum sp. Ch1-1]|uniref:Ectoine/hydroxyectoine ABC transporter substrate-binding protein EhuB n=1 Tax=Methylomarinum roseum TaxID=3067653 RepID=A0AAU7NZL4_9GAMM|nr:ectoine/hydroxyectoine ABC transporter substrate-binding protein EhuB [Methylomarinum sp. Ch1-1]MDP4521482.1 ectoine/hydroxyectoine ABC transporter substrate-binding protein EhuB [Methylomarinum sp. Ch1-1]
MHQFLLRLLLYLNTFLIGTGWCLAESTLEKARLQGVIRVGFANEAPFSYATSSGRFTGESPEVFKQIMQRLGVARVEGVLTEWATLIPGLKAGRFDAIVSGMYITPRRCKQILFSNPTYAIDEAFIVKNGNPEGVTNFVEAAEKDVKLALVAGTVEMRYAKIAGLSRMQWVVVPDFASAVATVRSGRAAAAALTSLTAKTIAAKDDAIESAEPFVFTHQGKRFRSQGAFGFRKEDDELRDAVNNALAEFIGSEKHLELIAPFGFDAGNLPDQSADQLCRN